RRRGHHHARTPRPLRGRAGRAGVVRGRPLGDEYLGAASGLAHWRDSHCRIEGPAVLALQLTFLEDWYWATHNIPRLHWRPWLPSGGDRHVVVLPSGPADDVETCTLFFMHCITRAQKRLWIASPYFVPDLQILHALQLASLRGVDVRVLIPENPDHRVVWLAAYSYLVQAERAGVGIYRYKPGFMHQKVLLVDDRFAAIGTANLDNRSMRLNFEVNAIVEDETFVEEVERMLVRDLAQSRRMTAQDYRNRSTLFRLACRAARLMAPLL
ncbi:MAG: phospholipase D-like domain-containing protein, partial [Gammaproteobacteria bacterium]|nr:phospholipase D-like domain-containing protein [Gammaproteobacteria bacterium]